ncbi:MAG: hypothetical protein KF912_09675 [Phycisphaeraceae bacterium]|nr:hypothetical protein [Phycisphaeraceae bacterium]QYK46956.1 MAG: hypothetical protein KF838_09180 [Phycisphaeraceae bacterium]
MPILARTIAQAGSEPVSNIRDGFGLLILLIGICVALVVIALGMMVVARKSRTPGTRKRHAGPKVDAWKEAGARARTPTAWELEKSNRPRVKRKKEIDPDAFEEGLEGAGDGSAGGPDGDGGGDGGGD